MKRVVNQQTFNAGIADSEKEGLAGSSFFSQHLNIYQDPRSIQLFPAPVKVSGNKVVNKVKWIVPATGYNNNIYFYDVVGNIYVQLSDGEWEVLETVANSAGNGFEVSGDYLYYTGNNFIGRYGPLDSVNPVFNDTWQTGLNDTHLSTFAPVKSFKEGFAVGHGNFMAWWDGANWFNNRIQLPPGFNIRTFEVYNEYLVIGAWQGVNIFDNDTGYLFFWDGASDTFNFFATADDGGVAAILNSKNNLISFLGSDATFYSAYQPFVKLQQLPKVQFGEYVDIYPGAVTNWRSLSFFGVSSTNSVNLLNGVYAYGAKSSKYADALCYAFTISTGNSNSNVQIGSVKGIGNNLYIGWRDGNTFGVDKVVNSAACFTSGYYEQLIFDNSNMFREKRANRIKSTHLPLTAGQSIKISTSIDRAVYTDSSINTSGNETNYDPAQSRFKEIQTKVTLASTSGISPRVTSIAMLFDDQKNEEQF